MTGIIILDFNNASDTIKCLKSVEKYTPKGTYKTVVVENGSNQNTVNCVCDFVKSNYKDNYLIIAENSTTTPLPSITVLVSPTNDGYARGNNKALKLLEDDDEIDYIMILNNDILFVEDIVSPLVQKYEEISDCALISPLLVKKDGMTIDHCCARKQYPTSYFVLEQLLLYKDIWGILKLWRRNSIIIESNPGLLQQGHFEIGMPSGSCMLIKKELFKQIGYFDNNTFLYFEENILYHKTSKINKKNYLVPNLKCIHLGSSTTRKNPSTFIMKCQIESEVYYLRRYRNAYLSAMFIKLFSNLTILRLYIHQLLKTCK